MRVSFRQLCFALALFAAPVLHAATFTVNTTTDSVDANPGDGNALDGSGLTSLRAAIMEANALGGHDNITLPAGTYALSIAGSNEDACATGDLDITSFITIHGATAATTIIQGTGNDRVIHVLSFTAYLILNDATIQGGAFTGFDEPGGGIWNNGGDVEINDCVIKQNSANLGGGGVANFALFDATALFVARNSTITDNSSPFTGGGLINVAAGGTSTGGFAQMILDNCVISENDALEIASGILNSATGSLDQAALLVRDSTIDANNHSFGISASGIVNAAEAGAQTFVTVERSTISNHLPPGGGMVNYASEDGLATFLVENSTVSGNFGVDDEAGRAAGIWNQSESTFAVASMTVRNSTITNNTAIEAFEGSPALGAGGIGNIQAAGTATFTLDNTIVAGNFSTGAADDAGGTFVGNGNNLIGNTAGSTGFSGSDLLNVNPMLSALANNGGPTLTHALLASSPAINAGNNAGAPVTDQRGLARIVAGVIDIGAFERNQVGLNDVYVNFSFNGSEQGSQSNPFNTLTEALSAAAFGADIHIAAGTTSEEPNIVQAVRLLSTGGLVRIGVQGGRDISKSQTGFVAPE